MKFKFTILLFLFLIISSFSRVDSKPVEIPQNIELNIDGLYYAEFYDYIFRGHFENIKMKRDDPNFLMIFEQYLRTYGAKCSNYLPANKVEIMELVCAEEEIGYNGYGQEIRRDCIKYRWDGTGLFARRDLYNAKIEIEKTHKANGLSIFFGMITDQNAMGNSVDLMHRRKGLNNDMSKFFTLNQCNSKGVKRFEENLKLFALNKPGIRMKGSSKYAIMKKSGGPSGSQNFSKLIDDLIYDQSKTWSLNRYTKGSISGLTVLSKDSQGRPVELRANYSYSAFGNKGRGWTKVIFKNGLPECIYFFDFPNNCKTPNSSVVANYSEGKYANK
jgi:hypothetical protein